MIIYKSPDEIEKMRRAGRITAGPSTAMLAEVAPGVTTADLDAIAERSIRDAGAHAVVHGLPGRSRPRSARRSTTRSSTGSRRAKRVLEEGDVLSLDCGAIWEGFHGDSAVTVFVGGEPPSPEADEAGPGHRGGAGGRDRDDPVRAGASPTSAHAIQQVAEGAGFALVREYGGHGIGRALHEDPFIQNYGPPGRGPEMKPGLVIAVEPMVNLGGGTRPGSWRTAGRW